MLSQDYHSIVNISLNLVYMKNFGARIMASDKIEMIGYHATTQYCAKNIMSKRLFYRSKEDNEWLGEGIYFWDREQHCDDWRGSKAIICVKLACDHDRFLDLDNETEMDMFCDFARDYCQEMIESGDEYPAFDNEHLQQCFFCDIYKHVNHILLIKKAFTGGVNCAGFRINKTQLCASYNSIIEIQSQRR